MHWRVPLHEADQLVRYPLNSHPKAWHALRQPFKQSALLAHSGSGIPADNSWSLEHAQPLVVVVVLEVALTSG